MVLNLTGQGLHIPLFSNSSGGQDLISFGNQVLGLDITFAEEPGTGDPATGLGGLLNVDLFENSGHGRIDSITAHVVGLEGGILFEGNDSVYEANTTQGSLFDGDGLTGLDGNNLKHVFVHGPLVADVVWDNSDAGDGTDSMANVLPSLLGDSAAHLDAFHGLGSGHVDSISAGFAGSPPVFDLGPFDFGPLEPAGFDAGLANVVIFG